MNDAPLRREPISGTKKGKGKQNKRSFFGVEILLKVVIKGWMIQGKETVRPTVEHGNETSLDGQRIGLAQSNESGAPDENSDPAVSRRERGGAAK